MIRYVDLGLVHFSDALKLQEVTLQAVGADRESETLFLLEHHPVYTVGSSTGHDDLVDATVHAVRTNRGGRATFHGPGQLVGYPVINLHRRRRDLHLYLRFIEDLLQTVAAGFDVATFAVPGRTGVWTEQGKLASIGVGVRQWVTMHGFALNVNNDPEPFKKIVPCGVPGCPMTSLAAETGRWIEMSEVKKAVVDNFSPLLSRWLPLQDLPVRRTL